MQVCKYASMGARCSVQLCQVAAGCAATTESCLSSLAVYCGLGFVCEPYSLFSAHLQQRPLNRMQAHQARQALRPDFLFHLPERVRENLCGSLWLSVAFVGSLSESLWRSRWLSCWISLLFSLSGSPSLSLFLLGV